MRKLKHQTMIMIRKTVSLWTCAATLLVGAITLTSCSHNEDDYKKPYDVTDEERVKYAEKVLGISVGQMANTGNGTLTRDSVKITLPKPAGFDFQKCSFILGARVTPEMRGVYDSDYYAISIAQKGQDPHGIVIPGKWQRPTEQTCITKAYPKFADWAHDIKDPTSKNWYMFPVEGEVVKR